MIHSSVYSTMNGLPRPGFKLAYAVPMVCILLAVTVSQTSLSRWSQRAFSSLQHSIFSLAGPGGPTSGNTAELLGTYIREQQSQRQLQDNPWAVTADIDDFTKTKKRLMIFQASKVKIAREVLESMPVPPKVIIEFGTYVGSSAIAWGAILHGLHGQNAAEKGCRVYTFELDPEMVNLSRELIHLAGLDEIVHVLEGPAAESLEKLYNEGAVTRGGVDMAFIDHWERYYLPDLQWCEKLGVFHKGSLVIADNTDIPGAPQYLKYVRTGGTGSVKYDSKRYDSKTQRSPSVVEISTVTEV